MMVETRERSGNTLVGIPDGPLAAGFECGIKTWLHPETAYMEVTKTLKPGDRGTARLLRKYGERLVYVRYRFDPQRKKNLTTVELLIDERDAPMGYHPINKPRPQPKQKVLVQIDFHEVELRARVKEAGELWDPQRRGWVLPFSTVREMGLEERILEEHVPGYGNKGKERGQVLE